jgi:hypothetical protein
MCLRNIIHFHWQNSFPHLTAIPLWTTNELLLKTKCVMLSWICGSWNHNTQSSGIFRASFRDSTGRLLYLAVDIALVSFSCKILYCSTKCFTRLFSIASTDYYPGNKWRKECFLKWLKIFYWSFVLAIHSN